MAAEAGDAIIAVSTETPGGLDGVRRTPEIRFLSEQLQGEAARAEQTADLYENWLTANYRGDQLAPRFSQLEWPAPELEPVLA